MATYSSILACKIPWTEELGGLQSMGSQRVRHDWVYACLMTIKKSRLFSCTDWLVDRSMDLQIFLCNFLLWYLLTVGIMLVFSLRWSLPPALGCVPKQPDSGRPWPGTPGGHYQPHTIHRLGASIRRTGPPKAARYGPDPSELPIFTTRWFGRWVVTHSLVDSNSHGYRPAVNISHPPVDIYFSL